MVWAHGPACGIPVLRPGIEPKSCKFLTTGEPDQIRSAAQSCLTLCDPMNRSTPGLPVHHQLPEFTETHVHRVSDAIQPSHPLSSPSPLAPNPSQHQSLSNESTLRMRWPKYWSLSFIIIPSKEIPGLMSFRMDWLDLPAVQGTLKSLLQHHSSKTSILQRSAFFTVQLAHPYMTTGKTKENGCPSNRDAVHLKLTECCMSKIPIKLEEENKIHKCVLFGVQYMFVLML